MLGEYFDFFLAVLDFEPRALCVLGEDAATELHSL